MSQQPDVFFTPVPDRVLAEMLRLAVIDRSDVVYDLGCGDGRVVTQAVLAGALRGVGVDIDAACVAASQRTSTAAGVEDRTEFRVEDIFTTDLRPATVIALYLLDSLNVRLRPAILAQCQPGTRVVSYSFEMGEWECDAHTPMAANGVSLWVVPANLTGRWEAEGGGRQSLIKAVVLHQEFQRIAGSIEMERGGLPACEGRIRGHEIRWTFEQEAVAGVFHGWVDGDRMSGMVTFGDHSVPWSATRVAGTQHPMHDGRVVPGPQC